MDDSYKYFERNYASFWAPILSKSESVEAANEIRIRFMRVAGMIASIYGLETAGSWTRQFAILAEDVEKSKAEKRKLDDKTIREYVAMFRSVVSEGKEYQRKPEDQSALFKSDKWKAKRANGNT